MVHGVQSVIIIGHNKKLVQSVLIWDTHHMVYKTSNSQVTVLCLGTMATKNIFLKYDWSVGLFVLKCSGNETTIWNCTYNKSNGGQYCYKCNDASVFCMSYITFGR